MTDYSTHADLYQAAGWTPIPLHRGKQATKGTPPEGFTGWDGQTPTPEDQHRWRNHTGNIAIRLPATVIGIDVDAYAGKQGDQSLAALEAELGPLPETWATTARTDGSGIRLFTIPDGLILDEAHCGPGIEIIQRHHRFAVVHPSLHPKIGERYRWVHTGTGETDTQPPHIDTIPDLPEPWCDRLERTGTSERPDGPINVDWSPKVVDAYQSIVGRLEQGDRNPTVFNGLKTLIRHSQNGQQGAHAAIAALRNDYITAFAGGNDRQTPTQAAQEYDELVARNEAFLAAADTTTPFPTSDNGEPLELELPTPRTLNPQPPPPQPFPTHLLPAPTREWVEHLAWVHQTDPTLPATVTLATLSTLTIRGNIRLRINNSWTEHPNLYAVVAIPPGGGKSPVYRDCTRPLRQLLKNDVDQQRIAVKKAGHALDLKQKQAKRRQDAAIKDPDLENDALVALLEADEAAENMPYIYQPLAQDITPEAFTGLLGDNRGSAAILDPEGGFFDGLRRYVDNGKNAHIDPFLKAFSGDDIIVHRKSQDEPTVIDSARAVICLISQPATLEHLYQDEQAMARGLTARFLIAVPNSNVGERDYADGDREPDPTLVDQWTELVNLIGEAYPHDDDTTVEIGITAQALDYYHQWRHRNEQQLGDRRRLHPIVTSVPKIQQTALRLATIAHIAEGRSPNQPIDLEAMQRAVGLADWWLEETLRYVTYVHDTAPTGDMVAARKAVEWLRDRGESTFMLSDLVASSKFRRSHGDTVRDMHGIVDVLVAYGWAVPEVPEWHTRRGCRFLFNNDRNVMEDTIGHVPTCATCAHVLGGKINPTTTPHTFTPPNPSNLPDAHVAHVGKSTDNHPPRSDPPPQHSWFTDPNDPPPQGQP